MHPPAATTTTSTIPNTAINAPPHPPGGWKPLDDEEEEETFYCASKRGANECRRNESIRYKGNDNAFIKTTSATQATPSYHHSNHSHLPLAVQTVGVMMPQQQPSRVDPNKQGQNLLQEPRASWSSDQHSSTSAANHSTGASSLLNRSTAQQAGK
jgi:hypothetical protein